MHAPQIARFYGWIACVLFAARAYVHHRALEASLPPGLSDGLLLAYALHLVGLLASITTYRLFFHRLTRAGFVGPLSWRVSKLSHAWLCRASKNHEVLEKIHDKYGDFVRTGASLGLLSVPRLFEPRHC